jgi:2-oxoglutarate ferredoxin oxidoreductase subunit beta
MTFLAKPKLHHPTLKKNRVGYTRRDYEGRVSTLCAGCGHDSISAAIIEACWELDVQPHRLAKLSGIGCSSKTPDYFLGNSHGFNTVHGRMPSVLTGANLANRDLVYLGVSGDGDSASIGLGQFAHVMRRGVNMLYILENNGVYGLTKGQFSATADAGSKAKRGAINKDAAIDTVSLALIMGATFVARSFSGDKKQLVPLVKAGLAHSGAAFIDVSAPASPSTTTPAPPRATTTSATITKPSTAWISGPTAKPSTSTTAKAPSSRCRSTTAPSSSCARPTPSTIPPTASTP